VRTKSRFNNLDFVQKLQGGKMIKSLKELTADLWVFDCDGVIYENAKLAEKKVVDKMNQFIASKYGCGIKKASVIRNKLLKKHNVSHSIMALTRERFNEQEILDETYFAINLNELCIAPSLKIQKLVSCLKGTKVVLTNNHSEYTRKVLDKLGILNFFSAIYGIKELGTIQKPDPRAFQFVQGATGIEKILYLLTTKIKIQLRPTDLVGQRY